MDVGDIISDSIKYPSSSWGKVLILGIITIASILIVPFFLVLGYMFRIIKATLAGIDELPEFDEIGDMFVDGLKVFVVGFVYAIPVWILSAIVGLVTGGNSAAAVTSLGTGYALAFILGNIVFFIIAVIIGLIELMAIANMAYNDGDLGTAFRFSEILDIIATIGWGKYIITYIVIVILAAIGVMIGVFTMFIIIGIILLPLIILPYLIMFEARGIGLLFSEAMETSAEEPLIE
ncbi:hypothetical protein Metbo_0333 [Methanobacterium lacus]|jgi:hypothetical protein|uniref:DUF4013 domain-containing protein n=1 Tax=Methanobacterium lacus (strain AL-21) TaxID=877455 RepID=F0T8P3_METLA|nr:DUF4013 domain-containing protein [Methanobacterium lacus]ADZ08585.1 hypothetical protein Metbo_0333 [Methanobacterium lacus]